MTKEGLTTIFPLAFVAAALEDLPVGFAAGAAFFFAGAFFAVGWLLNTLNSSVQKI